MEDVTKTTNLSSSSMRRLDNGLSLNVWKVLYCIFFGYPIVHVFQCTGPITSVSKTKVNAPSHLGYPFTTFLISRISIKS